ncbi:MAG: hypothetical protein U0271_24970 [Polyangiaceae bacterium]
MRDTCKCPKCHGTEILYLPRLTDYQRSTIAAHVDTSEWKEDGAVAPVGQIEVYACRNCGFAETYVVGVDAIDVDQIEGAKLLRPRGESPFR